MDSRDNWGERSDLELIAERASLHISVLDNIGIRTKQGSFYTPLDVVENLLAMSLVPRLNRMTEAESLPRLVDPSCGTGNFLVVAALQIRDRLVRLGQTPESAIDVAVSNCIYGVDSDVVAVETCRELLSMLTDGRVTTEEIATHVVHANSLTLPFGSSLDTGQLALFEDSEVTWTGLFPDVLSAERRGFDVVIGNPPFLNQLEAETAMGPSELASVRDNFGASVGKMTNPSSVFMLIGQRLLAEGGSLLMIQPLSFLATAHSAGVRSLLASTNRVSAIWVCTEKIFDASVQVSAVHIDFSRDNGPTEIFFGRDFEKLGFINQEEWSADTWSMALSRAQGFPGILLDDDRCLESIASASAAFRDQYYGLVGSVVESGAEETMYMRLATVGLVDPASLRWGQATTRFARSQFKRPVVILDKLDIEMRNWAESMKCPKVMVATQTKVIECVVDETGEFLPGVPLVTIRCEAEEVWKVAAVLSAPPISLLAAHRHLGGGMSSDVLRVTAKELLALPLPTVEAPWVEAADFFRRAQSESEEDRRRHLLHNMGRLMCDAYRVSGSEVFDWWESRLPRRSDEVAP